MLIMKKDHSAMNVRNLELETSIIVRFRVVC